MISWRAWDFLSLESELVDERERKKKKKNIHTEKNPRIGGIYPLGAARWESLQILLDFGILKGNSWWGWGVSTTTLVAFNDVRVPVENLLGAENKGANGEWSGTKKLQTYTKNKGFHKDIMKYHERFWMEMWWNVICTF